jgi:hypothetical protein
MDVAATKPSVDPRRYLAQQAKSWELRAAMSMARLWRDQGKPQQARELLAQSTRNSRGRIMMRSNFPMGASSC